MALTQQQTNDYYAKYGNSPNPISPTDYEKSLSTPVSPEVNSTVNPNVALQTVGVPTTPSTITPVDTSKPNPNTVSATPYTGNSIVDALKSGGQPSDFASRTELATKEGIPNYTGTADQNTQLLQKYQQGLKTAQSTGTAPDNAGQALQTVQDSLPTENQYDTTPTDTYLAEEPVFSKILDNLAEMMKPEIQQTSLAQEYQDLTKSTGLQDINMQLVDAKKVIDGTTQDIRNEIMSAGGTATESQVQAMSVARNKLLIQNYNQLLGTKNALQDQIDTTINLSKEDRAYAQTKLEQQMNLGEKLLQYKTQFINNAKENYNTIVKSVGYSGLYDSTGGDINQIQLIQKTLGLPSGGLAQLAQSESSKLTKVTPGSTLYDPNTGKSVYSNPKVSSGTGSSKSNTNSMSTVNISSLKKALDASKFAGAEADGKYADPNLYLANYNSWIKSGGSEAEFFKNFPPATYINPDNTFLPENIMKFTKKTTSTNTSNSREKLF